MTSLDLMRRYLDAIRGGDWDGALSLLADDVVLHVPGRSALAGIHRGRDAARAYIDAALARTHGGEVEVELIDMLASEDRVALIVRERLGAGDGAVEFRRANVYTVRGGRIAEVWIFEADQYAVDDLFA